ncbi:hypothetical protein [Arthrospiribacter ruber]|uniref:Transposase n=1 Tax=Arthrospiribacter ruber TaxID=2487934 RepID=A0A951J2Y4_9BACT|nr:hypothetical protein [Arthrospiribacter ruber]MBW3470534.1 hypothetical protein [Arthrospiribacter ruber]
MCFRGWGVIVPSTKYEGGRRKEQVLGFGVPGEGLDALIRIVFAHIFLSRSGVADKLHQDGQALQMVLVRRGARESRACPECRDRRLIIIEPFRKLGGFFVFRGVIVPSTMYEG